MLFKENQKQAGSKNIFISLGKTPNKAFFNIVQVFLWHRKTTKPFMKFYF